MVKTKSWTVSDGAQYWLVSRQEVFNQGGISTTFYFCSCDRDCDHIAGISEKENLGYGHFMKNGTYHVFLRNEELPLSLQAFLEDQIGTSNSTEEATRLIMRGISRLLNGQAPLEKLQGAPLLNAKRKLTELTGAQDLSNLAVVEKALEFLDERLDKELAAQKIEGKATKW